MSATMTVWLEAQPPRHCPPEDAQVTGAGELEAQGSPPQHVGATENGGARNGAVAVVEGVPRELDRVGVDVSDAVDDDASVALERGDLTHSQVPRFTRANFELGVRRNRRPHAVAAGGEAHGLPRAQELEDDSSSPVDGVSVRQGAPSVCRRGYFSSARGLQPGLTRIVRLAADDGVCTR